MVKCEMNQALVMIRLNVKFIVHPSYAKQVKSAKRRKVRQTDGPGDDKIWAEA